MTTHTLHKLTSLIFIVRDYEHIRHIRHCLTLNLTLSVEYALWCRLLLQVPALYRPERTPAHH